MNNEERRDSAEPEEPVVRDRRKIDPQTGERRESSDEGLFAPAAGQSADDPRTAEESQASGAQSHADAGADDQLAAMKDELAKAKEEAGERLEDLKRLQAEYVNYRRRVERDREAVKDAAKAEVLGAFLDVLDDIGRARDHGDLTGGFRSVGESLEAATAKAGLVRYGEPGDVFDPMVHEALMHSYSDDVSEPTCVQILQPGYRVGERVLRAARVAVAEPTEGLPAPADGDAGSDKGSEAGNDAGEADETGANKSADAADTED